MRKFFLLTHPAYGDGCTVASYHDLENYDSTKLWHCRRVPDNYLDEARLRLTPGKPWDYIPNSLSWPIVSPRLLACFQKFGTQMQILDARILDESGHPALEDYKVLNLLQSLKGAVDLNKSTTSYTTVLGEKLLNIMEFVFRQEAIPLDAHVFKVAESISDVVVSADFAREVREAKMEGVVFLRTKTV